MFIVASELCLSLPVLCKFNKIIMCRALYKYAFAHLFDYEQVVDAPLLCLNEYNLSQEYKQFETADIRKSSQHSSGIASSYH